MIENKKLLELQYYYDRMSLFMNNSLGFKQRTQFFWSLLNCIDSFYDDLIDRYDVLNNDYIAKYYSEELVGEIEYNGDGQPFIRDKVLDKVGALFSTPRSFNIKTSTKDTDGHYIERNPATITQNKSGQSYSTVNTYITLNNIDYLKYIRLNIAKQYFKGTQEEIREIYGDDTGVVSEKLGVLFYYFTNKNSSGISGGEPAEVSIYWSNVGDNTSLDLQYMFLNGLLTIESLGILYSKSITDLSNIGIFDVSTFNNCVWG